MDGLTDAQKTQKFGLRLHEQNVIRLERDIVRQKGEITSMKEIYNETEKRNEDTQAEYNKKIAYNNRIVSEMEKLDALETPENAKQIQMLKNLVALNENFKTQEAQFKSNCKRQRISLQQQIDQMREDASTTGKSQEAQLVDQTFVEDLDKLKKLRQLAAKKNRDIALVERKIDEVPSRTELSQYQRQFVELYETVAGKETETRQYYTTYNTLEDTKKFLQKEVSILNSIQQNYKAAMSSKSSKEQLLNSLTEIIKSVIGNLEKMSQKFNNEKDAKAKLTEKYSALTEKERLYYKATKEFLDECRKNEMLTNRLNQV